MSWDAGTRVLARDEYIGPLIRACGPLKHRQDKCYFRTLVWSIIAQQISSKAAESISRRVRKHVRYVTPARVVAVPYAQLRALGLSNQKASYVHDVASKFLDKTITPRRFHSMSDEAIIAELVQVRGIGRWTAEMFLIFSLCRDDVWPVDDLGIQKAVQRALKLKTLPNKKRMQRIGEQWRPYRSVASMYLWRSLDGKEVTTRG